MRVIVNGMVRELAEGTTLAELIEQLGLSRSACAAEVDLRLVRARDRAEKVLREGERVEIVSLVGGG